MSLSCGLCARKAVPLATGPARLVHVLGATRMSGVSLFIQDLIFKRTWCAPSVLALRLAQYADGPNICLREQKRKCTGCLVCVADALLPLGPKRSSCQRRSGKWRTRESVSAPKNRQLSSKRSFSNANACCTQRLTKIGRTNVREVRLIQQ